MFILVAIGDNSNGMIKVFSGDGFSSEISFQAHTNTIYRIKQLPNGYVATCSEDSTVKIWIPSNTNNWILVRTHQSHTLGVIAIDYINADTIVSGDGNGVIEIWSKSTGVVSQTLNANSKIWSLKMLKNNIYLAAGLSNGNINIYNLNNSSLITTLQAHASSVMDLVLINDDLLASSSDDVRVWNVTTFINKFILIDHTNDVFGMRQISSSILASGACDHSVILWNITDGALLRRLDNQTDNILYSVDLLDAKTLVSGSQDSTINFWNYETGQILNIIFTGLDIRSLAVLNLGKCGLLKNFHISN